MLERDQVAVLRVKRVKVALVEEVFVVEESALPRYFFVAAVYLGKHHIHEDGSTQDRQESEREMSEGL